VEDRGQPTKKRVRDLGRRLITDVVLDFRFVNYLEEGKKRSVNEVFTPR